VPEERWTATQVLALAPDAGSARSARGSAGASAWSGTGAGGGALWGSCRGSGQRPYQVCVDLAGPAYRCTCPSRKFPCKHALGLLLLWADGGVGAAGPPEWVTTWQGERAARASRTSERRAAGPVDEDAARKRADRRAERVAGGLDELDRWLLDQVTHGLAEAERSGERPFEAMAARLVDAQAGALAEAVRRAGRTVGIGPHWADRLLGRLALLRLVVAGHRRLDELPPALAATVRSRIGFPVSGEQVLAGPRVRDRWQVVGRSHSADDRLLTRRTWLRGAATGRPALLLAFAPLGAALPAEAPPGTAFDAELCFYPGAAPVRALVAERRGEPERFDEPAGATTVRAALAEVAARRAADPWLGDVPVLLDAVRPAGTDRLVDRAGDALALRPGPEPPWWLLAVSGGHPVTVAGELGPAGFAVLAAWAGEGVVLAPDAESEREPAGAALPPELVSAALVGVGRRPWAGGPVPVGGRTLVLSAGGPAAEGAGALLDAAAVALTYREVGAVPVPGAVPEEPADGEVLPMLPPAAAARLDRLVAGRGVPGGAEIAAVLLTGWLQAAAGAGYRVPTRALPTLLDLGRRHTALRPAVALVAGRRGSWLAARRAEWRYLLGEEVAEPDPAAWETGTPGERLAHLAALRHRDPAAGLALLTASFDAESPDDRARFLGALARDLSPADEPLLERALRDRRREVRDVAAELLARLPGSALGARMAARATAAVRVERRRLGRDRWLIDPPAAHDADLARDGIAPPTTAGGRGELLEEIVARTPLGTWTGAGRNPAEVLAMAAPDEWALAWRRGLVRAVVAQGATTWAEPLAALLAGLPGERRADGLLAAALPRLLPPERLAAHLAERLRRDPNSAHPQLEAFAGAWPEPLARAVFDALAVLTRGTSPTWHLSGMCAAAARSMPVGWARPLAELGERVAAAAPHSRAAHSVPTLAAALTFRHQMIEELR
jgi:uncharacterized protein DUF5691/SWIM zinc finger